MKTVFKSIVILIISLLFYSCNLQIDNLSDNQNDSNNQLESGYAKIEIILSDVISRSVIIPDFSGYKDKIKSYSINVYKSDSSDSNTYSVTSDNPVVSVNVLYDTEYDIYVSGKDDNDNVIARGSSKFIPTSTNSNVKVTVSPVTEESVQGTVNIPIEFAVSDCSYVVEITITNTNTNSDSYSDNKTIDCTLSSQTININQVLDSCIYKVKLCITNSNYPSTKMNFEYDLLVYPYLESKWLLKSSSSTNLDKISFEKDDLIPVSLEDYVFYVIGTNPSSLGDKTPQQVAETLGFKKAVKFDTVQKAVDAAVALDSTGTIERQIVIDGVVTQIPESSSDSLVMIGNGTNTPNIVIKGFAIDTVIQRDVDSTKEARIFYVNVGAKVSIENLSIKNGKLEGNGGGIFNAGKMTLKNVNISDCSVNGTGAGYGGGIYSNTNANLTFNTGSIKNCSSTNSGGGYYYSGLTGSTGETSFINVNIEQNSVTGSSSSGGGVYICSPGKFMMTGGTISNNTSTSNGGGIVVYANKGNGTYTNCYLQNVTMKGNTAKTSGGAVFIPKSQYLSLIDCNISGNDTSNEKDVCTNSSLYLYGSTTIDKCYILSSGSVYVNSDISGETTIYLESYTTGKQVLSAINGSLTQEMIEKFSIDDSKYYIDSEGKLAELTGYTDWETLVNAVNAIPAGTTTETSFEIGGDMIMTSALTSSCPIRLYSNRDCTITRDSSFSENIFSPTSSLKIEGVGTATITFDGNNIESTQAFILLDDSPEAIFTNIVFKNFSASNDGAAVSSCNSSSTTKAIFTDCKFEYNITSGIANGGAVCIDKNSNFMFNNCAFSNNQTESSGGAIAITVSSAQAEINNCTFNYNHASVENQGGAIYLFKGKCTIKNVNMSGNTAGTTNVTDNDIYYYTPTARPELVLSNNCKIPCVFYSVATTSSDPSIIKIEDLDFTSRVGIQMSMYTYDLSKDVVQKTDYSEIDTQYLTCFNLIDSGYKLKLNNSNTGICLESNP